MGHLSEMVGVNMSELVVVRHGQTTWNAIERLQGQAESDLSEIGVKQAQAVAERLARHAKFTAVYSSDLKRASETAQMIADRCGFSQVILSESLRERHLGSLQGLTRAEAQIVEPKALRASLSKNLDEPIPGGGESLNQLYARTKAAYEEIALKHLGQRVVVVSHGAVLKALHLHAKGMQPLSRVRNTSINVFRISSTCEWTLRLWGDVNHLQGTSLLRAGNGGDEMT